MHARASGPIPSTGDKTKHNPFCYRYRIASGKEDTSEIKIQPINIFTFYELDYSSF